MNNLTFKTIAPYFLGAAIGGAIGYMIANIVVERLRDKEFELAEIETDKRKEKLKNMAREELSSTKKKTKRKPKTSRSYSDINKKPDQMTLNALASKYAGNPVDSSKPRVITVHDYTISDPNNIGENYLKVGIKYFQGDNVFTDEDDVMIPHAERFVGYKVKEQFGELSDDPDIVYIRNDSNKTDYEVVKYVSSYREEVIGSDGTERSRKRRGRNHGKDNDKT